jgi:hypothetical protein
MPPPPHSYGLTSAQYQAEFNSKVAAGYSLVWVNGYRAVGGAINFIAKFELVSRQAPLRIPHDGEG